MISNVAYTYEREQILAFSIPSDIDAGHLFSESHNLLDHLVGAKIAVERGTIWRTVAEKYFPYSEIKVVDSLDEALTDLSAKRIQAMLFSDKFYSRLLMFVCTPSILTSIFGLYDKHCGYQA